MIYPKVLRRQSYRQLSSTYFNFVQKYCFQFCKRTSLTTNASNCQAKTAQTAKHTMTYYCVFETNDSTRSPESKLHSSILDALRSGSGAPRVNERTHQEPIKLSEPLKAVVLRAQELKISKSSLPANEICR